MRRGSRLVKPDCIQAHDVEDADTGGRVETPHVIVAELVDPLPGARQQRRVLLHDGFRLVDQWQTAGGIDFPVDPRGQRLELHVVPERVVLRAVLAVPGTLRRFKPPVDLAEALRRAALSSSGRTAASAACRILSRSPSHAGAGGDMNVSSGSNLAVRSWFREHRNRRNPVVAGYSGQGPFTEPTGASRLGSGNRSRLRTLIKDELRRYFPPDRRADTLYPKRSRYSVCRRSPGLAFCEVCRRKHR